MVVAWLHGQSSPQVAQYAWPLESVSTPAIVVSPFAAGPARAAPVAYSVGNSAPQCEQCDGRSHLLNSIGSMKGCERSIGLRP